MRKEEPAPAPQRVRHPEHEVLLAQKLLLYPEAVFPVVADHLPLDFLTDPDCRLLVETLLDHPDESLMDLVPADRQEAQRLAARIQVEESKLRGPDIDPAAAAQDLVMDAWRRILKERRRRTGQVEERAQITMQLKQLDLGWAHAVDFMVVP